MINPEILAKINVKMIEEQRKQEQLFIANEVLTQKSNVAEQSKSTLNQIEEKFQEDLRKEGLEINALEQLNQREKSQMVAISSVSNIGGKTINRLSATKKIQDSIEEDILEKNFESRSEQFFKQVAGINVQTQNKLKEIENFEIQNRQNPALIELEKEVAAIKQLNNMFKFEQKEKQLKETEESLEKTRTEIESRKGL